MKNIPEIRGTAYDGDEIIFDNNPGRIGRNDHSKNLHEKSLLAAIKEVGERRSIDELLSITPEQSINAFHSAPEHTIESGVIYMLNSLGMDNLVALLGEIIAQKDKNHLDLIISEGTAIDGSVEFVHKLSEAFGIKDRNSMATTSPRRDAKAFLSKIGLTDYFPDERLKAKEDVKLYKPFPEVYNLAFASLKLPENQRREVLAVDDNPRGITAALRAGLFTAAVATTHSPDELRDLPEPPHLIVESFAELSEIFGLN